MIFCGCCIVECAKLCYICKKEITIHDSQVQCIHCNISMHNVCYTRLSESKKNFNCPSCKAEGTIGIDINNEDILDIEL